MSEPAWFLRAMERIRSEVKYDVCDTPEKAAEHQCRLGDTVLIRKPPQFGDAQAALDDARALEILREFARSYRPGDTVFIRNPPAG